MGPSSKDVFDHKIKVGKNFQYLSQNWLKLKTEEWWIDQKYVKAV